MENNNNNAENNNKNKAVLDTSALMALFNEAEGANTVYMILPDAIISVVNLCEVISEAAEKGGISSQVLFEYIHDLGLKVVPFDLEQAQFAARLAGEIKEINSFTTRACLALAYALNATIYTADRTLARLNLPVKIHLI